MRSPCWKRRCIKLEENEIMVTISMASYNHKKFVRQAIESVLKQKVDFKFEIIITDDASTDGTNFIIMEYAQKYPDIIRAKCWEKNIGILANLRYRNSCAKGRYIACLECDDFWTDEHKLQRQVEFLEKNSEYSLCFTDVDVIKDNTRVIPYVRRDIVSLKEYLADGKGPMEIPSATMVYRNIFRENPKFINYYKANKLIGDRITHTLLFRYGKYKYLPINSATYRYITKKGFSFSGMSELVRWKDTVLCYKTCIKLSEQENYDAWYKILVKVQKRIIELIIKKEGFVAAFKYYITHLTLKEKYYLSKEYWK